METNNSKPTPRVNEQPERFDEVTGGYDMVDHDRAAKRIMADLRKMPQRVEGHTPGPWRMTKKPYSRTKEGPSGWNVRADTAMPGDPSEHVVATAHGTDVYGFSAEANARLIASAPDLLAACQRVLRAIEWGTTADRMDSAEQAELLRAAIARATA
jgi:hypothetical protein